MKFKKLIIVLSLVTFVSSNTVWAKMVPNIDAIPDAIRYPEGQQIFDEQMVGVPANKKFGMLPNGLEQQIFLEWIAPNEDPQLLTLIGAKAWGKDNTYIGVACFARNSKDVSSSAQYQDTNCSEDFTLRRAKNFYLGVFKWQDNLFQPIAVSTGALDATVSWQHSNLIEPVAADNAVGEDSEKVLPQSYTKLDLAPYHIAPNTMAFGIRADFNEMYSGGGAFFEALQLFMVKNDQIVNILSEPMYYYQNIAGEWHEDGTRDHDINEGKNILMVLTSQTDGYYDLRIKSLDSKWRQDFVWSTALERYVAK